MSKTRKGSVKELIEKIGDSKPGKPSVVTSDDELPSSVEPNVASLTAAVKQMLTAIKEMSKALEFQSKMYDDILAETKLHTKKMDALINEINACKKENTALAKVNEELRGKLNDMEQYSKSFNLEFHGIPETDNENTYAIVTKIAKKLNYDLETGDVEMCHRLKKNERNERTKNAPPVIIAKFYSRQTKEDILSAKREKKVLTANEIGFNSTHQVHVNEHLTNMNKNLFWLARNTRSAGFKFAWVRNAKIFIRKTENSPIIRIRKATDIPTAPTT
jgi:hypothetical protein